MIARHHRTGRWMEWTLDGDRIAGVAPADGPEAVGPGDDWLAPAFWDLQVNGRWGVSFSDPSLTADQVAAIVLAQAALGTAQLCPTLISAPAADMLHGLRTIAEACDRRPDVAARVAGLHLEGPYLSGLDGYRGAHPFSALRDPDWDEFRRMQDASGGRVALVTLAPERPGALAFIAQLAATGVIVAIGHTAADGATLRAAADAGARLSTHLGNGIAAELPRHPNPIWHQAADDRLTATLIADGHHLDPSTLRVLARAKGPGRVLLVSDASPLAGLPPGTYGPWAVEPSGRVVVAGTPYLAGASRGLESGVRHLIRDALYAQGDALDAATILPARLLRRPEPALAPGRAADLVRYRLLPEFTLLATCVGGQWTPDAPPQS